MLLQQKGFPTGGLPFMMVDHSRSGWSIHWIRWQVTTISLPQRTLGCLLMNSQDFTRVHHFSFHLLVPFFHEFEWQLLLLRKIFSSFDPFPFIMSSQAAQKVIMNSALTPRPRHVMWGIRSGQSPSVIIMILENAKCLPREIPARDSGLFWLSLVC